MQVYTNPGRESWKELLQRPYVENSQVLQSVHHILDEVKLQGDSAIRNFTRRFEGAELHRFDVTAQEIDAAASALPEELKEAILQAKENIELFHLQQIAKGEHVETMPGVQCWRKSVGIEKVGLYVPGGTAPLFSTVLMLGIPARIAGCKEIILCTPAGKEGIIHPSILFAAQVVGVTKIFKIGGAQAIAAMAYGTESIPAVYKIFGPGNQYVTAAKQLVQMQGVAIDMPAGPSEVCVLADETANPQFVAADLLSQAEHGSDSQVLLVSTSSDLVHSVAKEIDQQLAVLPRKDLAAKSLGNSKSIVVEDMTTAVAIVNEYAAEHLILSCVDAETIADKVVNAGSVFIGNYTPESAGDYASGTNHTLPTNGFARAYSGVSVDSYVRKITYQKISRSGINAIGKTIIAMAEAEGLDAHANAVRVRLKSEQNISHEL